MRIKNHVFDTLRIIARDYSTHPRTFLSAAIVKGNKIIATGVNRMDKTSSFQLKYGRNIESIYPHAEIEAIKNAVKIIHCNDFSDCYIYVCRQKFNSTDKNHYIDGLAKPCAGCMRAIITFKLKGIVYTTEDQNVYDTIIF